MVIRGLRNEVNQITTMVVDSLIKEIRDNVVEGLIKEAMDKMRDPVMSSLNEKAVANLVLMRAAEGIAEIFISKQDAKT